MSDDATTAGADNWWDADPYSLGGGLGIVLHQKPRNRWVVADVLRNSPAERAGVLSGDYVLQIDDYALSAPDADVVEFMGLVRTARGSLRLLLSRMSRRVEVQIGAEPMRSVLEVAAQLGQSLLPLLPGDGGGGGGGGCASCKSCRPTVIGWTDCGTGRRCRSRCLVA